MKYYFLLLLGFYLNGCSNDIKDKSSNTFLEEVKKINQEGKLDSNLFFRLKIYDKYITETNRRDEIEGKSIYQIIAGLGEERGTLNDYHIVGKDHDIKITKEISKDSLYYRIKYKNETERLVEKMNITILTLDLMGSFLQGNTWICEGINCLNNYSARLPKRAAKSNLVTISEEDADKYGFNLDDEYLYSRFKLQNLRVTYSDGEVIKYEF